MIKSHEEIGELITGMVSAYERGENAMAWARNHIGSKTNETIISLIAYDLQAGSYVKFSEENPDYQKKWCRQLSELIMPYIKSGGRILEVGVGEATTLAGVLKHIQGVTAYGFDISWSRVKVGEEYLIQKNKSASLFVADLFKIPMADNSIDVVYTSHSLEPSGGKELDAIQELLRISKTAVVLIEPLYELANKEARRRMEKHGYVKNLKKIAEKIGASVEKYNLLPFIENSLNPSGVLILNKNWNHVGGGGRYFSAR